MTNSGLADLPSQKFSGFCPDWYHSTPHLINITPQCGFRYILQWERSLMDGGKFPIRKENPYMNENLLLLFILLVVLVFLVSLAV